MEKVQSVDSGGRLADPAQIALPAGYSIEVAADRLNVPINVTFTDRGELLVADSGITDGNGKVLRRTDAGFEMVASGFHPPLTGITWHDGRIYVAHRGAITAVDERGGGKFDVLRGLPSRGDHHNNRVVFGPDGWMYFGQGTATNSGVVGEDNDWVKDDPFFCDLPGADIELVGQRFETADPFSAAPDDRAWTSAFRPFRLSSEGAAQVPGAKLASGSILRARPDGSQLELVAWGLRNPFRIRFDRYGRLFAANHGPDVRGSRPIREAPDEFQWIRPGTWYGWPDYSGGWPVTMPHFKPANGPQPTFLLARHPMRPPMPVANFAPHSATMGFDFCEDASFGPVGDVFIAEFGSEAPETTGGLPAPNVGHRVSRIDMRTGAISPFAINRSGVSAVAGLAGGFARPIDAVFGPDGALYVADFGLPAEGEDAYRRNTGVLWRIVRNR